MININSYNFGVLDKVIDVTCALRLISAATVVIRLFPKVTFVQSIFIFVSIIILAGSFKMCGIFAYLNYLTPKTRKEIVTLLINGLKRLEYRGYDSAGKYLI